MSTNKPTPAAIAVFVLFEVAAAIRGVEIITHTKSTEKSLEAITKILAKIVDIHKGIPLEKERRRKNEYDKTDS